MRRIHLICNAHIDPIWQWDIQEGISAVLSTFNSAANLAEKHDYIFCHNEALIYKYVEEYAPELFERIKKLVRAGKWHIMGGWYLQPDCNMPSGESFVRQIKEGHRYFKEKFGVIPTTSINFDPFGHTVGLVQIIKKCGCDSYIYMRPNKGDLAVPDQFIWRGLDGSEIKAARSSSYNSPLGHAVSNILKKTGRMSDDTCVVLWGVGNHGGGPSDKDLSEIAELIKTSEDGYFHSTPEKFFSEIEPTEVFDRSLRTAMPGCYTSMRSIKSRHARLESELMMTEKAVSTAYMRGLIDEYPERELRGITEDLMLSEFHDVLPGTSVRCGEESGIKLLEHGLLEAERLKTKAFFALSSQHAPSREGEYPILVFNPHPYSYKENVECSFMLADQNWDTERLSRITVLDESGRAVATQQIKEESNIALDWSKKIVFEAELAPFEMKRYSAYAEFVAPKAKETDSFVFDNGRKRVEIDRESGLMKSYSVNGVEYVKNGFELMMLDDNPDPWAMSGEQQKRVGANPCAFGLSKTPSGVFSGMKSVQVIEDGDVYLGIEAFFEKENTRARVCYKIYKNNDFVDVDVDLFTGDINKMVKLNLPVSLEGVLLGQTAFGTEELFTDARENVAQRFVGIKSGERLLALINNGVYGSNYENGAIGMSLWRGISYCAHPIPNREILPSDKFTKKADIGEYNYSFRLGLVDSSSVEREAQRFNEKPIAVNVFPVTGDRRSNGGFNVSLSDDSISVVTVKKACGRDVMIFRLLNNTDGERRSTLRVDGAEIELSFGKYEVKTLLLENGRLTESENLII